MAIDEEGRLNRIDYKDRIFFDSVNGIAGTIYPIGTAGMPSSVIADVITICTVRRITSIEVQGALVLGADMTAYQLLLIGDVTLTPGANNCNAMIGKGALSLAGVTGGITNIYVTGGAPVTIAVSCNGGTINIYGDARVTDNSAAGCTVNDYTISTELDTVFREQADTAINITAIAGGETDVFDLNAAATRYIVRNLRLKCADPGADTVTVRLRELVNDVSTIVSSFDITTANFGTYYTLMDMFGIPHLAGDDLQVTVQASGGGPYVVVGQYSHAISI